MFGNHLRSSSFHFSALAPSLVPAPDVPPTESDVPPTESDVPPTESDVPPTESEK